MPENCRKDSRFLGIGLDSALKATLCANWNENHRTTKPSLPLNGDLLHCSAISVLRFRLRRWDDDPDAPAGNVEGRGGRLARHSHAGRQRERFGLIVRRRFPFPVEENNESKSNVQGDHGGRDVLFCFLSEIPVTCWAAQ